jgi:Tol biopolymer transport system component
VFGPGTGVLAGIVPLTGDDPTIRTYTIWDQGTMSDQLPGEPLAWSADGSKLAVLKPTETIKVVDLGTLSIVDKSGRELLDVPNWVATTWAPYVFSPDGAYIAACLQPADGPRTTPEIHVVDLNSGNVSSCVGKNCIDFGATWGQDSHLFVSDATGRAPVVWTPQGISRLDTTFGWATPALNGNLALWSDGTDNSSVELRAGDSMVDYQLPQLRNVTWSPDGATVAAISAPVGGSEGLTLIPVAP